jgi:radical SAM protein with 4Fe4S-binding SPASM domain
MSSPKHLFFLHFDIVHGYQLRYVGCPNSILGSKNQSIPVEDFARCLGNIDVDADGTIVPCCYHPRADVSGNLMTQKYSEILSGVARLAMKQENRAAMPVCGRCEVGPIGNEGPSFFATINDWRSNREPLADE